MKTINEGTLQDLEELCSAIRGAHEMKDVRMGGILSLQLAALCGPETVAELVRGYRAAQKVGAL